MCSCSTEMLYRGVAAAGRYCCVVLTGVTGSAMIYALA